MPRTYNFSAGPAALPESLLRQVQTQMLDYDDLGYSIVEMSHRSTPFMEIAERSEESLRRLLNISNDYHVLFLQGGPTLQFAMVPLNLAESGDTVEYAVTGYWSRKAHREGSRLRNVHTATESNHTIPDPDTWVRVRNSRFLYFTTNETIEGVQFSQYPSNRSAPLVCDATSDFLTRPMVVDDFGLIFAGAQKNFGPAGLTVVIVRKDLCRTPRDNEAEYLNYAVHAEQNSMYNTPNTFAWYFAGLYFDWLHEQGGVEEMHRRCQAKSKVLYDLIDSSELYKSRVDRAYRSLVNVTFTLPNEQLTQVFLRRASQVNLKNLKGHRAVGGIRASLYNATTIEAVEALAAFMRQFEAENI